MTSRWFKAGIARLVCDMGREFDGRDVSGVGSGSASCSTIVAGPWFSFQVLGQVDAGFAFLDSSTRGACSQYSAPGFLQILASHPALPELSFNCERLAGVNSLERWGQKKTCSVQIVGLYLVKAFGLTVNFRQASRPNDA